MSDIHANVTALDAVTVVHAWPDDVSPITPANASAEDLDRVYGVLRSKHVVRRVEYDVEAEIRLLLRSDDPFAHSTAESLRTGQYVAVRGAGS